MKRFLINAAINTLSFLVVSQILPNFVITSFWGAFWAAIVFALLNSVLKPILIFLTLPINILTFGLLTFVINAGLLALTSRIVSGFYIEGFWVAFFGAIILTLISTILTKILY